MPDWVSICVRARLLASMAKSASRIVEREDSVFWILDIRLESAKPNRFWTGPKLERWSLMKSMAASSELMVV